MVSLFKNKSGSAILWITLLCIFVHLSFIFERPRILLSSDDTILDNVLASFSTTSETVLCLAYLIIVSIQANRLNAASNNLLLFQKENLFPGMTYVLFTALLPQWCNISSQLIINTLYIEIFAASRLLYAATKPERLLFSLSMLSGVGAVLYPPSLVWALILFFSMLSLSNFKFRLIIVWVIGLILPLYFMAAYLFLTGRFPLLLHLDFHIFLQNPILQLQQKPLIYMVAFGFVVVTVLIGILSGLQNSSVLLIVARKAWGLSFLAFLLIIGNAFLFPKASIDILLLSIVPASLLGANTFYYTGSKWLSNIWFWLIILGIYYTNLHTLHVIPY